MQEHMAIHSWCMLAYIDSAARGGLTIPRRHSIILRGLYILLLETMTTFPNNFAFHLYFCIPYDLI